MTTSATETATHYAIRADVRGDYAVGPAILARVDSRLSACGYVHAYAPIAVGGVDRSAQFWDEWGEVEELAA